MVFRSLCAVGAAAAEKRAALFFRDVGIGQIAQILLHRRTILLRVFVRLRLKYGFAVALGQAEEHSRGFLIAARPAFSK